MILNGWIMVDQFTAEVQRSKLEILQPRTDPEPTYIHHVTMTISHDFPQNAMVPDRGGSRWPYWRHRDAAAKNPRWRGPLRGRQWASSKRCPTRLIRLTDMTNPYKLDSIYPICTYVLYVNLSQSLSIYKAQQILLGMSMPCRCHAMPLNRQKSGQFYHATPCYTMLYLFFPYSTPSATGPATVVPPSPRWRDPWHHWFHPWWWPQHSNPTDPTGNVPHHRYLGRGVTSGECTSLHKFTQVYTSLHCGKWETWETELWMNHDESRTAPSSVSPDDPRCNNINMQWSLRITDITVTDKSLTHLNHLTLQPSGRLVAPSRQDGRLVHQILQVSTAEAGSS